MVCVCVRVQTESSDCTIVFPQTMPVEHPPMPPPSRWAALIILPQLAEIQFIGAARVMLCCLPPASSSTPLWPSVYYAGISDIINIM